MILKRQPQSQRCSYRYTARVKTTKIVARMSVAPADVQLQRCQSNNQQRTTNDALDIHVLVLAQWQCLLYSFDWYFFPHTLHIGVLLFALTLFLWNSAASLVVLLISTRYISFQAANIFIVFVRTKIFAEWSCHSESFNYRICRCVCHSCNHSLIHEYVPITIDWMMSTTLNVNVGVTKATANYNCACVHVTLWQIGKAKRLVAAPLDSHRSPAYSLHLMYLLH